MGAALEFLAVVYGMMTLVTAATLTIAVIDVNRNWHTPVSKTEYVYDLVWAWSVCWVWPWVMWKANQEERK